MVASNTLRVKNGEWVSLVMDNWSSGNVAEVNAGQYILLRFVNNSGANAGGNPSVAFRVTNLLIRAVS